MLLSSLIFLPILFALIVAVWPHQKTIRHLSLGLSVIHFGLSLTIFNFFNPNTSDLQLVEKFNWIPDYGITYFLGIDGISIWLVMLTTFLVPLTILGSWNSIQDRAKSFHISVFVLSASMLGTFLALDAILFYLFWELSLVPMYFMIGIWGGSRRIYATVKFFIFTMVGSVLMLVAIIYMMFLTKAALGQMSSSLLDFYKLDIAFVGGTIFSLQSLLFFAFALAFAIKVPLFPFHTWLPDAHVEAPTPGSVLLAGVMLKMGTYGLVRWALPLFPEAAEHWAWVFYLVGIIGIIYGAMMAMVQTDIKKLVAYSSVSHMGYIIIGIFALNHEGLTGGIYQMLNHGVSTGALFFLVGMIYERTHTREIGQYGGLASALPKYTILFFIITLSSIAVPMTNGFVGEFLILLGAFIYNPIAGSIAALGVVLGAVYMLWMFKRVFFGADGPVVQDKNHPLVDLSFRELGVLAPLVVLVFVMGLFPNLFFKYSEKSVDHMVKNKSNYQLSILNENKKSLSAELEDK